MKKNKTMAYTLAAALLVGGTFVGTKAIFEDKADVVTELAISTGNVDIVEVAGSQWTLTRNGAELADGTTANIIDRNVITDTDATLTDGGDKFTQSETKDDKTYTSDAMANNLKPGDELRKTVTIKNAGTLVVENLNVTPTNQDTLNGLLQFNTPNFTTSTLKPGQSATFELVITVMNDNTFNTIEQENKVVDLTNAWEVTVEQQDLRTDSSK